MADKKGRKNAVSCDKCGTFMRSVFSDMERTYHILACPSCTNQVKLSMK
ncbi:MAG: hypothetical protein HY520_03430 [Candidatus Aenigmarchaeota archaeon]|nr:hypothetical protein [Candidatus Aenigmarchaeota archaeon]